MFRRKGFEGLEAAFRGLRFLDLVKALCPGFFFFNPCAQGAAVEEFQFRTSRFKSGLGVADLDFKRSTRL